MLKRLVSTVSALAMVVVVAGCGAGSDPDSGSAYRPNPGVGAQPACPLQGTWNGDDFVVGQPGRPFAVPGRAKLCQGGLSGRPLTAEGGTGCQRTGYASWA
jgi:hypothetical protein